MITVRNLITHLETFYNPDSLIAVAIWSPDDVLSRAEDRGVKIDRELACDIIHRMHENHDAETGYSWATIDFWLDELAEGGAS